MTSRGEAADRAAGLRTRTHSDDQLTPNQRRAAVRLVCANAHDTDDARRLLDALGLDPREGR